MNTPMSDLLEWFKENQLDLHIPQECVEMVEHYIKHEKSEIIKARENGIYTMINGSSQEKMMTSEEYYHQINFNTEN